MTTTQGSHLDSHLVHPPGAAGLASLLRVEKFAGRILVLEAALLLSSLAVAQNSPTITGIDPASGKVNDSVTVSGSGLGKDTVTAVFLSDDKSDYKAVIVTQTEGKIVMKVPQVKPGRYNVSIQVGNGILIEPIRFTVQE
jgi:IPT/TIG domain-containing protein